MRCVSTLLNCAASTSARRSGSSVASLPSASASFASGASSVDADSAVPCKVVRYP